MVLLLIKYAKINDSCATLEAHTILRNYKQKFSIVKTIFDGDPFEVIEASLEAAETLCSNSIWIKSVGILLNYGMKENLHYLNDYYIKAYKLKKDRLKDFIELAGEIDTFKFLKRSFFIKSHFYGKRRIKNEDIIKEFEYLIQEVSLQGNQIEINASETFYISILYKNSKRKYWQRFNVKNFDFIGRTSMNIENSVFTSNMCDIRENMTVYDPCSGSGSLILIPALKGSYVVGSDIDILEMIGTNKLVGNCRTKLKGTNVFSNFYKFGVFDKCLGILEADAAKSPITKIDRVLVDIPYGRRISLSKQSSTDFFRKIGSMSAKILVEGGILGLWSSITEETVIEGLSLISKYFEKGRNFNRSLFVYKKVCNQTFTA